MIKKKKPEEQLQSIEKRLANAENDVAPGLNRGSAWGYFDDWNGKSGHPLWMKNFMLPVMKKARARVEKTLETVSITDEKKRLSQRRRRKS